MLPVMINMRNFFIYPALLLINSAASLLIVIAYGLLIYKMGAKSFSIESWIAKVHPNKKKTNLKKKSKAGEKERKEEEKELKSILPKKLKYWAFLRDSIKGEIHGISSHFVVIYYLKDTILVSSLIFFLTIPHLQVLIPILYNLFLLWIILKDRPLKDKMGNFLVFFGAISEVLILGIHGGLILLQDKEEKFKFQVLGKPLTILMISICVINIAVGLVDTIMAALGVISFLRAKFRLNQKIQKKKKTAKKQIGKRRKSLKQGKPVVKQRVRSRFFKFFEPFLGKNVAKK